MQKPTASKTDVSPRKRRLIKCYKLLTMVLLDLGRTPDLVTSEFSQNNTLLSISYWHSIEELEAFARRPIHLKGLKFLVTSLYSDNPHDLGVIVSNFSNHILAFSATLWGKSPE